MVEDDQKESKAPPLTRKGLHYVCEGKFACHSFHVRLQTIGSHNSLDNPPCVPMFTGGRTKAKQNSTNDMTTVFTSMAEAVIGALKPSPQPGSTSGSAVNAPAVGHPSPGKIADVRSKYIQQLRELHSLFEMGALTDKEFSEQKLPIPDQLKKFKV